MLALDKVLASRPKAGVQTWLRFMDFIKTKKVQSIVSLGETLSNGFLSQNLKKVGFYAKFNWHIHILVIF
jgi:hypothetical protein